MRSSRWFIGLGRALALVGALGVGSALAWAEDESDSNDQDRASQSRDDDRSSRDDDSSARSGRNQDDRDDADRSSSRTQRSSRNQDDRYSDDARRGQQRRNQDDRYSQDESSDRSSRQSRDQYSQDRSSSRQQQQQDVGAEFDTNDDDQLIVSSVEDDSIAHRARLQEDDVIISVDGRRFNDSRQLTSYLRSAANRRVPIVIERDGHRYTVQLQQSQNQQHYAQSEGSAWLGVYLDDNEDGPVITQIYPNGPAQRAGLRRGDVVVQFNNEDVTDSEELVERIEAEEPNTRARFTVLRDGEETQLTATLADRNQFIARGQNQQSNQYWQDQGRMQYTQRPRQYEDDSDDWQTNRNQRQYTEFQGQSDDSRGYSRFTYPGRGQQFQDNRQQGGDQTQRLERMIHELREEVRELRERVDNQ